MEYNLSPSCCLAFRKYCIVSSVGSASLRVALIYSVAFWGKVMPLKRAETSNISYLAWLKGTRLRRSVIIGVGLSLSERNVYFPQFPSLKEIPFNKSENASTKIEVNLWSTNVLWTREVSHGGSCLESSQEARAMRELGCPPPPQKKKFKNSNPTTLQ